MSEVPQSWVGTWAGEGGWEMGRRRVRAVGVQLLCLSAGLSESHFSGLVDGQGLPGVNMFIAAGLGGRLRPRGDFRT